MQMKVSARLRRSKRETSCACNVTVDVRALTAWLSWWLWWNQS
jgi:hypothetical protein